MFHAGVAQLVERDLAKVEVASSSLVTRSFFTGDVAEGLGRGLQSLVLRFKSGRHLFKISFILPYKVFYEKIVFSYITYDFYFHRLLCRKRC